MIRNTEPANYEQALQIASDVVKQWTEAGGCVIDNLRRAFRTVFNHKAGEMLRRDQLEPGLCQILRVNPMIAMMISVVMAEWYCAKDRDPLAQMPCRAFITGSRADAVAAVTHCLNWLGELEEEALTHSQSLAAPGDAKLWEAMIARSNNGVSAEAASPSRRPTPTFIK